MTRCGAGRAPQAQFLEALQQRGDEIIYVYCDREYSSFCMSMASSGVRVLGRSGQEEGDL